MSGHLTFLEMADFIFFVVVFLNIRESSRGGRGKAGISVLVRLFCFALNSREEPDVARSLAPASALTHYREIHLEVPQCSPPHADSFFEAAKFQKQAESLQSNYTLEREREDFLH